MLKGLTAARRFYIVGLSIPLVLFLCLCFHQRATRFRFVPLSPRTVTTAAAATTTTPDVVRVKTAVHKAQSIASEGVNDDAGKKAQVQAAKGKTLSGGKPDDADQKSQARATEERTIVWRELKRVTEYIAAQEVTIFLRAGTWLAAYRQAGYSPFDRDNDFSILDSDVPRAKQLLRRLPSPYRMVWKPGSFLIEPFVEGWPLMDGAILETNLSEQVVYDRSWKPEVVAYDLADVQNYEELNFYDGILRAPANSPRYLRHTYGADCLDVQVNKCARNKGSLFLTDPKKCNFPCYRGALDFPHKLYHNFTRGEIDTTGM